MAGIAVAGTDVDIEGAPNGLAAAGLAGSGLCRTGTCMGTEPRPICTEGPEAGPPAASGRGPDSGTAAAGGANAGDAAAGGGVGPMAWGWPGKAPKAAPEVAVMVGPMAEKLAGSGGTAVFATLIDGLPNSGGGVGGSISARAAGFGAGAAPGAGAVCSLAPQPRQNL